MSTINTRFKELRKKCGKTQEEWGRILGITRPGVADIESGRRNVIEKHLIMLSNWHERKINIEWLRTGEGGPDAMFLPLPETPSLDELAKFHNATHSDYLLIRNYLSLDPDTRKKIHSLFSFKE